MVDDRTHGLVRAAEGALCDPVESEGEDGGRVGHMQSHSGPKSLHMFMLVCLLKGSRPCCDVLK